MAPRRGEVAEERREGEAVEVGEKISAMEGKFSNLEETLGGRLSSLEETLRLLVEAQRQQWTTSEKGKGANPNPNPIFLQDDEEESLVGGGAPPPTHIDERAADRQGRPCRVDPRQAAPWAGGGGQWAGHLGPTMGGIAGYGRGGPSGREGGSGHLGPTGGVWHGPGGAHYGGRWEHGETLGRGNFFPPYGGGRTGPPGEAFHQGSWGGDRSAGGADRRMRKLALPLFEGEDAYGWIYRVERYFALNGVTEEEKLMAVPLCLEGKALAWF